MRLEKDRIFKAANVLTACIAGICLFVIATVFVFNSTLLDAAFHRDLFKKHDLYSHVKKAVDNSISSAISSLGSDKQYNLDEQQMLLSLLQQSLSLDMIKNNMDSISEGLFKYFKGYSKLLPDIYLPQDIQVSSDGNQKDLNGAILSAPEALAKINKINLSTILLYLNRNDINDGISSIRLLYYATGKAPGLAAAIIFLMLSVSLLFLRRNVRLIRWINLMLFTGGILTSCAGISLMLFYSLIVPGIIYPIAASIPIEDNAILSYITGSLSPSAVYLGIGGVILLSAALVCYFAVRLTRQRLQRILTTGKISVVPGFVSLLKSKVWLVKTIKYVMLALVLAVVAFEIQIIKKDFVSNGFEAVVSRMVQDNNSVGVIPAKDDTLYILQLQLIDSKTGGPVADTAISVNGWDNMHQIYSLETGITSNNGIVRFSLGKGTFRVNFPFYALPEPYIAPAAFYCELKTPGTTIITVNVDSAVVETHGIAEIEILDAFNKPVSGLELGIGSDIKASHGNPEKVLSVTNSEGIAVFKLNEGSFKILFSESSLYESFEPPAPFEIAVTPGQVTRYTLRLVSNSAAAN